MFRPTSKLNHVVLQSALRGPVPTTQSQLRRGPKGRTSQEGSEAKVFFRDRERRSSSLLEFTRSQSLSQSESAALSSSSVFSPHSLSHSPPRRLLSIAAALALTQNSELPSCSFNGAAVISASMHLMGRGIHSDLSRSGEIGRSVAKTNKTMTKHKNPPQARYKFKNPGRRRLFPVLGEKPLEDFIFPE